jgi:Domain of unknown function (DUF4129)
MGKMMSITKRNALLLLSMVGVLIVILAMSLPNLALSPGQPFSLGEPQGTTAGTSAVLPAGDALLRVFQGILALILILFPLYVIYSMLTSKGRQRLLAEMILMALLFLFAAYLHDHLSNENPQNPKQTALTSQNLNAEPGQPSVIFSATPPPWLAPVIILVASILVVAIIFVAVRVLRRPPKTAEHSLEKLAQEAQSAIEALQLGGDFKITVIQCYREMSRTVRETKGIERDRAMTAREFEDWLISRGLPQESVRTLTRLFEQVRYGSATESIHEESLALSCLTNIVDACKTIENTYASQ